MKRRNYFQHTGLLVGDWVQLCFARREGDSFKPCGKVIALEGFPQMETVRVHFLVGSCTGEKVSLEPYLLELHTWPDVQRLCRLNELSPVEWLVLSAHLTDEEIATARMSR